MRRVVTPTGRPAWLATSYADVRLVLSDPRFGKAPLTGSAAGTTRTGRLPPGLLFTTDGAEHRRLRAELLAAMRRCPSSSLRPGLIAQADTLLADAGDDLIRSYAAPLAMWAVGTWLGVPAADWQRCATWSSIVLSVNRFPSDVVERAQFELIDHLASLLPGRDTPDLLTALDFEASAPAPLAATVLATGYETLVAGIANAALTLLTTGSGFRSWPTSPIGVRRLIDELLRYAPLGGTMRSRCALEDVPVGDVVVSQGEVVLAETGPANRDPSQFPDPDTFCPARTHNRHLALGVGERFCIGSQLAVMGLTVGLERIAVRYPEVRLAVDPAGVEVVPGAAEPRPEELPVRWG